MNAAAPSGWEGILDEDERILWQGRPIAGLSFQNTNVASVGLGLFFVGFSIYWMAQTASLTIDKLTVDGFLPKLFPLLVLPFLYIGVFFFFLGFYNAIGHVFWEAHLRSKTHYTLSSKRAFIATDHPRQGKLLKDYNIDANTDLSLKVGPPDSIFFESPSIGFQRIEDGRAVHKMMRQIQKDLA